jgi:hypothetical protein
MSERINTGNIKAENKKISDDFINLITDMFGVIDEVSEKIGDGKYLELANQFKKLSEFKEKMGTNIVYIEHEKRTQMRVLKPKERRLTYAEKLKDKKKYYKCHKCDCVLTRKEKPTHEKTQKCKKAYSSRMITLAKKTKVNSDTLIVLDDMLDTRRPYIMVETEDINEDKIKTEKRRLFTTEDYYSDDTEYAAVMVQKLWRGKSVRKNVKVYDGVGELPNFMKTDTWQLFKSSWKREGKIPIYRLSEYWRKFLHPTDTEKREKQMFEMIKHYIYNKKQQENNKLKWKPYRKMIECKTKNAFNEVRKLICRAYNIKIKGVSKMSRKEIEIEIARQLW